MTLSWPSPRTPTCWSSNETDHLLRKTGSGSGPFSRAIAGTDATGPGSCAGSYPRTAGEGVMSATPKKPLATPDGAPTTRSSGSARKSTVSEVQDPLIAGDEGKNGKTVEAGELLVDEAGQVRRKTNNEIDLLH